METIRLTTYLAGSFGIRTVAAADFDKAVRVAVANGETILSVFKS